MTHSNFLIKVTNSFDLKLLSPIHQVPIHYSDNPNNVNSIINLIFIRPNSIKIDYHSILLESLDYISLTVNIFIMEEFIQEKQYTIIRNSKEEEEKFVFENTIENINTLSILDKETLETTVQEYIRISESIWYKFS